MNAHVFVTWRRSVDTCPAFSIVGAPHRYRHQATRSKHDQWRNGQGGQGRSVAATLSHLRALFHTCGWVNTRSGLLCCNVAYLSVLCRPSSSFNTNTMTPKFKLKGGKNTNYENSNISSCNNIIFKISSKRNQNPSRYYNFIINLKFQHKPKYHVSKNPHIKVDLLLPRGQNPLSYYLSTLANLTLI